MSSPPQNTFVADFIGVETIWHGRNRRLRAGSCTVRTEAGIVVQAVGDMKATGSG